MTPETYCQELKYLPEFMRDFHDGKDLFKAIHELYKDSEGLKTTGISFPNGMIYTIDIFLWFMAQHGYKLQKIRSSDVQFYDLHNTILNQNKKRLERLTL